MPNTPQKQFEEHLIPLEKMLVFIKIAIDLGVRKIRITGGEPLLRPDLSEFIKGIYSYNSACEVALTTNGFFLNKYAKSLKNAGLKRINISLDSLKNEKINQIAQKNALDSILSGLNAAKTAGLGIKINMVPLKNINSDEIIPMLDFALENGFLLRYIEYMNNTFAAQSIQGLKSDEILEIIAQKYSFKQTEKKNFGPAKLYELDCNYPKNIFGIIAPHNDEFCKSCNRIRLTSDGIICPCLYFEDALNARWAIESGDKNAMKNILLSAIENKPEKNKWSDNEISKRAFYHTGG